MTSAHQLGRLIKRVLFESAGHRRKIVSKYQNSHALGSAHCGRNLRRFRPPSGFGQKFVKVLGDSAERVSVVRKLKNLALGRRLAIGVAAVALGFVGAMSPALASGRSNAAGAQGPQPTTRPKQALIGDQLSSLLNGPATPASQQLDDGTWMIPFDDTDIGSVIRVIGQSAESSVSVPVPAGLSLIGIRAHVSTSPDVDTGHVGYFGTGLDTQYVQVGREQTTADETEIALDLSGIESDRGRAKVNFQTELTSKADPCTARLVNANFELRRGALVFAGAPSVPTSVSAYFGTVLRSVEILAPSVPSEAESAALLRLSAGIVRTRSNHPPTISYSPLPADNTIPSAAYVLTARRVAISASFPSGLTISRSGFDAPTLRIGGSAAEMLRSVTALTETSGSTLVGGAVQVDAAGVAEQSTTAAERGSAYTFSLPDLGLSQTSISGVGRQDLPLQIDQDRLGGPVAQMHIHLEGLHTPVPKGAESILTLTVGGSLVASRDLAADEVEPNSAGPRFSIDVDVPSELLQRTAGAVLSVNYIPPGAVCKVGSGPFTLQLDEKLSYFRVQYGDGDLVGFANYPQVLLPEFAIATDKPSLDRVTLAARLMASLQRLAGEPLSPQIMSIEEASKYDGPALLVGAAPDTPSSPLALGSSIAFKKSSGTTLEFSTDDGLAALTASDPPKSNSNAHRLVLNWVDPAGVVADAPTSGGDAVRGLGLAGELLASIEGQRHSFRDLFGDTYLIGPNVPPVSLSSVDGPIQPTPMRLAPNYLARALPLLAIAALVAAVAGLMIWLRKRRYARRS